MPWPSNYTMMQDIDKLPYRSKLSPHLYKISGSKGEQIEESWSRNGVDALWEVLGIIPLRNEYHFRPEKCYTSSAKENRRYSESWRSQAMWDIQVCYNSVDFSTHSVPILTHIRN